MREGCMRRGISNGHGQVRTVIDHVDVEHMSAVQVDPAPGQIYEWRRWRCTIRVHACRIDSFARIAVEVELYGDAVCNSRRRPCRTVGAVAEPAPRRTEHRRAVSFNRK